MPNKGTGAKRADIGERMLQVNIRFWTNDIAGKKGDIIPKHAWASEMVKMEANKTHGIRAGSPLPFHGLMDLPGVIEKVLIAHGIILHPGKRMKKYLLTK